MAYFFQVICIIETMISFKPAITHLFVYIVVTEYKCILINLTAFKFCNPVELFVEI